MILHSGDRYMTLGHVSGFQTKGVAREFRCISPVQFKLNAMRSEWLDYLCQRTLFVLKAPRPNKEDITNDSSMVESSIDLSELHTFLNHTGTVTSHLLMIIFTDACLLYETQGITTSNSGKTHSLIASRKYDLFLFTE